MPPDEDGGEPKTGNDKPTKTTWDEKGNVKEYGNTLGPGDTLFRAHDKPADNTFLTTEIRSKNGEYSLKFEDGNLVLKNKDGGLLWSSETEGKSWTGDISGLKVGLDGSLEIQHGGNKHPGIYGGPKTGWSTEAGLNTDSKYQIVVKDDGSLVVVDAKTGETASIISPPDDGKIRQIQLHRPSGISPALREYIGAAELVIQQGYYQLGRGTPSAAPNLAKLLAAEGLNDKVDNSKAVDKYNNSVNAIREVKDLLREKNAKIAIKVEVTAANILAAKNSIKNHVAELNDFLDDVDTAFVDKDKDGKSDFETTYNSRLQRSIFVPETEVKIFKKIDECLAKVYKVLKETSDTAASDGKDVKDGKPDNVDNTKPGNPEGKKPPGPPTGTYQPNGTGPITPTGNQDYSGLYNDLLGGDNGQNGTQNPDGTSNPDGTNTDGTTGGNSEFGRLLNSALSDLEKALTGSAEGQNGAVTPGGAVQQAGYRGGAGPTGGQQGGGGGGMNPMMAMMPMMILPQLMAAMNKSREDREREREREEDERREEEREKEETTVAAAAAPPAPGTPAPGADMPAGVTAPAAATPPPPPPVGGPKTMVDMKLPDGSTQKVSSVVAQAVQKEMSNPMGSDARAAYAGTPGQSAPGSPWVSVESSNLRTGDVVQWTNRTGLLLVTDAGVQVLVNGQAVPLDPNNPPDGGNGDYGTFQGYFHPTGADLDDPGQLAAAGAAPPAVTSGPTSPPPPPAVPKPALDPR